MSKALLNTVRDAAIGVIADKITQQMSAAPTGKLDPNEVMFVAKEAAEGIVKSDAVQSKVEAVAPDPIAFYKAQSIQGNVGVILTSLFGAYTNWSTGANNPEVYGGCVIAIIFAGYSIMGRVTARRTIAGTNAAETITK